jgi:hypothetical protein
MAKLREELDWHKASSSTSYGQCVELARTPISTVAVRDSTDPEGVILAYSQGALRALCQRIKGGDFDNMV